MEIRKDRAMAALVRSFFEAFANGVMDGKGLTPDEKQQPRIVKQTMLENYDKVAEVFHEVMVQPIASLSYSFEELAEALRSAGENTISAERLMQVACKSRSLHSAMVEEYKRNFMKLLQGGKYTVAEHLSLYTRCGGAGLVDGDTAIRSAVASVIKGYAGGMGLTEGVRLRHATILRLMMGAMSVLLKGTVEPSPVPEGTSELGSMFLKVCGTSHNVTVMANEMDAQMLSLNRCPCQ